MIPKPIVWRRVTVWRLNKDGFEETTAKIGEGPIGTQLTYDDKFKLNEKDYRAKCDVCLAQQQGFGCSRISDAPGPYEYEGGCMDCKDICGRPPVYIGTRNYCLDHIHILNRKLGVK